MNIALFLEDQGFGTRGADIFYGQMPESPDVLLGVFDTPGFAGDPKFAMDFDGLQIQVRGASNNGYAAAFSRAKLIQERMLHYAGDTFGDHNIVAIEPASSVYHLKRDENNRDVFTVNFNVIRELTNPSLTNREMLS